MSGQQQWEREIASGYGSAYLDLVRLGVILLDSGQDVRFWRDRAAVDLEARFGRQVRFVAVLTEGAAPAMRRAYGALRSQPRPLCDIAANGLS